MLVNYFDTLFEELIGDDNIFNAVVWKMLIVEDTYTFNQNDADAIGVGAISANETSGAGYTAGGITLANVTVVFDEPTSKYTFDCDDAVWNNLTAAAGGAIIYFGTSNLPMMHFDFEGEQTLTNDNFTVKINTNGFLTIGKP